LRAILLVPANYHAHGRVAQPKIAGYLTLLDTAPEGANYLPPTFLLRLGTQLASVCCFQVW
jgi:hypothetical protein